MKKLVCLLFIFALAVPLVFAGGRSEKIVIYTSMYQDVIDVMDKALEKQFPKYDIEFVYGGTGQIQAKIAEEQAAGKLGCDMLLVAEPSYSLELKEKGMLHPYLSIEADNLAFDYDKDGYWYPVRISSMVLAFNPEKTAKNSVPSSFSEFANNAAVRGSISMTNPLTSGTSLAAVTALRDKYGYEYFEALGRQNITLESGAVALTKLEKGDYRVIMILEESVLKKRQEESSKLEVIYPSDGTIIIPSTIMTIADKWSANKNTKIAEKITDWFLSDDGQHAIVDAWMHSVRKDFEKLPFDSTKDLHANTMPVNWENCYRQREEIQRRFEELVTSRSRR